MCIPFWVCNSGVFLVIMSQLCMRGCPCEKSRRRWCVLHVHWQFYRLCGLGRELDYGKGNALSLWDLLALAVDPQATVRWGPEFSARFINRNKLAPSKRTYNLFKWKDEILGGQERLKGVKFTAAIIWVDSWLPQQGFVIWIVASEIVSPEKPFTRFSAWRFFFF